ncbi:MAG: ATP-binding protein [Pseudomonadota bacterium]
MHRRRKLLWQVFPSYLFIILLSLTATAWYATSWFKEFHVERTRSDLTARASLVAALARSALTQESGAGLDSLLKSQESPPGARYTIINPSGRVTADSMVDIAVLGSHSDRPEVRQALAGEVGYSIRKSYSVNEGMVYVAVPVKAEGKIAGVARASLPLVPAGDVLTSVYVGISVTAVLAACLAALLTFPTSKRLTAEIDQLKTGAERFAAGDLFYRMDGGSSREMGALAEAMNRMAQELHGKMSTIVGQRNELEAVLLGMVEAVLVLDVNGRLLRVNKAAESLLEVDAETVRGRTLIEAVRNTDLRNFVKKVIETGAPVESDLTFPGDPELLLQTNGSIMKDSSGASTGVVVVLNDVTRLRTLERIRKDFVANVSHELKTPVTSIRGFLETLKEGAINDPENAERFLDIVIKQTDRLGMIIEDLLGLSRIEQAVEKGTVTLEETSVASVVEAVCKACRDRALERGGGIEWDCDPGLSTRLNVTLLEQALINLVDNAVKYGEPGQTVKIECRRTRNEVVIKVKDQGWGIAREHLPRVFERFYRVDKARSREAGGTGLGLSIVKHIVHAHNGRITVESTPGKGSTFSVFLPATCA